MPKAKRKQKRRIQSKKRQQHVARQRTFSKALMLAEQGDFGEAKAELLQWEDEGQLPTDALLLLLDLCHRTKDARVYARVALKLAERTPQDPEVRLCAGGGCYATGMPALAVLHFEEFLRLAPAHPKAKEVSGEIETLRSTLAKVAADEDIDNPDTVRRLALTEQTLMLLADGYLHDVLQVTRQHLERFPSDARALNNRAEALYQLGRWEEALKALGQSIEVDGSNYHAHASRCRIEFLRGMEAESDRDVERLEQLTPRRSSDLTKAAEAFAFRGDDDRVLAAFNRLHEEGWEQDSPKDSAMLYFFAAVARDRRDDRPKAEKLWKQSLKYSHSISFAADNLEEMRKPPGQGSGSFYFPLEYWIDRKTFDQIAQQLRQFAGDDFDQSNPREDAAFKTFMKRHSHLESLIPALLDRSDHLGQTFAVELASRAGSPASVDALVRYIQSSRGTDSFRYRVASDLKQRGLLAASELEMWVAGKPARIALLNFRISDEPNIQPSRTEEVNELAGEACEELRCGEGAAAESMLRRALELDADAPDLWNNLAMALLIQGQQRQAEEISAKVTRQWPEYFFGQLMVANRLVSDRKFDAAFELLDKLQRREEFHRSEFNSLCKSFINYYSAKGENSSALHWLEMLEGSAPDDINIPTLRHQITHKPRLRDLLRLGGSRDV